MEAVLCEPFSRAMGEIQLDIIDPLRHHRWDELLLAQPEYTFFHSAPWARVLAESYGYRPLYFTWIEQGKISVLVPVMEVRSVLTGRRGVGLPFTDYCRPIISEEFRYPDVMKQIIGYGRRKGWDSIEIRTDSDYPPGFPKSSSYFMHTLDLTPGGRALFGKLRDSTRRNIKKSLKERLSVSMERSPESVEFFYRLNCETRKEHGLPPQPYLFFKNLYTHVLSRNLGFVVLASLSGSAIAGAIYFFSRETMIYKYGASLPAGRHLSANNLVMWKAIEWGSENGFRRFCFGRTDLHHAGLRRFKAGWGGRETVMNYYKYDLIKDAFVENEPAYSGFPATVWKHIPISLSKIAGRILYRHAG